MMNPNWPVWIKSSLGQYFHTQLAVQGIIFQTEDEDPVASDTKGFPRFQLRVDGPDVTEYSSDNYILNIYINLLLQSYKIDDDIYLHDRMLGNGLVSMAKSISLYKQNDQLWGCAIAQSDVIVTHYGELDKSPDLVQSTIERDYKITL